LDAATQVYAGEINDAAVEIFFGMLEILCDLISHYWVTRVAIPCCANWTNNCGMFLSSNIVFNLSRFLFNLG